MFNTDPFGLIILLAGLSLLPFVAMIATSYLKIVVVMSLIRNALGIQSIPPNMVLNAIALILSFYLLAPAMDRSWEIIKNANATEGTAVEKLELFREAAEPFRDFLLKNTEEKHLLFFAGTAEKLWADENGQTPDIKTDSFYILLPAFTVSELTRGFQIGFLVYLPFIAIDIIVSNILLAMGMMMVSPVTISLPFKLLLFVLVDGWARLIQGLILSYHL